MRFRVYDRERWKRCKMPMRVQVRVRVQVEVRNGRTGKMEDGSGMRDAGNMKRGDEDEDEDESPRSACGWQEEVPVGASRDQYCA